MNDARGDTSLPAARNVDVRAATAAPVEARDLTKTYSDGDVHALAGASLSVHRGEYVAIMGPSGSGKSTLLNLLGALDAPSSGEVCFEGQPLARLPNLDRLRAQKIGFVFQSFYLLPVLTAVENVQVPMFEGNLGPRHRAARPPSCSIWSDSATASATSRISSRWASGSAWPSPRVGQRSDFALGRRAYGQPRLDRRRRDLRFVRPFASRARHDHRPDHAR